MNTAKYLWQSITRETGKAMPVLSFPAAQKMGITVRELVSSSENQARAMEIVATETPTLSSVSLMDLSVEAEAFGATVRWSDNEVPTIIGQMIEGEDGANDLEVPEVGASRTGICVEAIRQAKARITDKPVFAGMIGPYSLAGRLCDVTEIMYLLYDEPDAVHTVLDKVTTFLTNYVLALREAGADGVVMAEPLAGLLSPDLNDEFSIPYVKRIIEAVQTEEFAVIYHNCGNSVDKQLASVFGLDAAAYHFGNAVSMRNILDNAPKTALCMGNIDPAGEFASGTVESITKVTKDLMTTCGQEDNFIISSGCDIPPHAKWDNIHAFFQAVADAR